MFCERFELSVGQLSIVSPFPSSVSPDIRSALISSYPENKKGKRLTRKPTVRNVRLHDINGHKIVIKEMAFSGREVNASQNQFLFDSNRFRATPSAQLYIVTEACRRYRERFGEELSVEEALGFYINHTTTVKQMIYPYYQRFYPNRKTELGAKQLWDANDQMEEVKKRLYSINVEPSDGLQYIILTPQTDQSSIRLIFVDTEDWILN